MKKIIASVSIVALTAMLVSSFVFAADNGQISATVTASVVAITLTPDSAVAYGVVSTSEDTTSNGVNDTTTITNTGTVNEDFEIKGQDSTGQVWTLAAAAGDATYAHKSCITTCDSTPTWTYIGKGSYIDLDTGKAPSGTTALDLQVTVPTANPGTGEATLPVDILATTAS
jgi:hypothetical protein